MKTKKQISNGEELRDEYSPTDLQHGVRGKYLKQYQAGTNIVRLAPDVVAAFPTEQAVNQALRSLIKAEATR
jgi:hypothetical protein